MNIAKKKIAYITLGCKLNFSETSTLKHLLENAGAETVEEDSDADIFIINTCSVTDIAEKKDRQLIRKIAHHHPNARIVVTGCYAQLRAEEIKGMEGISLVLGAKEKFNIVEHLLHLEEEQQQPISSQNENIFQIRQFDLAYSFGDRTRCFLKIQDGCDYFCSYCTIPYARGRSRSASIPQVLEAVSQIAAKGIKEIILTGVNTGDFGRDQQANLLDLLHQLDAREDIARYRISSIEPNLLTEEIIEFVASSRHFMPHFHIPLQAGNDEVLRLMRRRYNRDLFASKVQAIKSILPDAFIGVDVIAGMRGETRACFEDSRDFIASLPISQLHVFPYSERQGTKSTVRCGVGVAADKCCSRKGKACLRTDDMYDALIRMTETKKRHAKIFAIFNQCSHLLFGYARTGVNGRFSSGNIVVHGGHHQFRPTKNPTGFP